MKKGEKMDKDRVIHSLAVAEKMIEIAQKLELTEKEQQELFILGYLHDVGYEFKDPMNHNKIGGEILKESNYKYWKEVYYHGIPTKEYQSKYLDILNYADMSVNKYGKDVGFEKRLEDIKSRYGEESICYTNSLKLVKELKKKYE